MKPGSFTRRRALQIVASAAPLAWLARADAGTAVARGPRRHVWRGDVLGAAGTLTLYADDDRWAATVLERAVREVGRLDSIFSLYRPESSLCLLNRFGHLDAPPPDLVWLLAEARRVSEASSGAFDVTVQPLWDLYAAHFAPAGADPRGPSPTALERVLDLVDYRGVLLDQGRVALRRPATAVTLNGIAQGYVTDKLIELLKQAGFSSVLVDLGETRATGGHPNGRPWRIGIRNPQAPGGLTRVLELRDAAIATSAGEGTTFEESGRHHHLFEPNSGVSANRYLSVSVVAPTATVADALSTAISALHPEQISSLIRNFGDVEVLAVLRDGKLFRVSA